MVHGRPAFRITLVNAVTPTAAATARTPHRACQTPGSTPRTTPPSPISLFTAAHPGTSWRTQIAHTVKIGLGTDQYELIRI
ncbi:MAG: hypothetical protein HFF17_12120 [Oscillospiraceae bacterium]|nr:hypothetical protein [Oscillospiraceae bacterium]